VRFRQELDAAGQLAAGLQASQVSAARPRTCIACGWPCTAGGETAGSALLVEYLSGFRKT
jgi:hypothetical protein